MPPTDPPTAALQGRRIPPHRVLTVIGSLVFASAVCLGMYGVRRYYMGRWTHVFIVRNLVLAWIPMGFAFAACQVRDSRLQRTPRHLLFAACALAWFFFFPNAPYIITDFIHIDFGSPVEVFWTDVFIYAAFSWTGLCLGYVSLCLMQEIVAEKGGRRLGWLFVLVTLAVSSFGIYIGRFLRWNSWDLLRHPIGVFRYSHNYHDEFAKPGMTIFMALMFGFLVLSYGTLYALAQLHERRGD